jgi:hypothetical protein
VTLYHGIGAYQKLGCWRITLRGSVALVATLYDGITVDSCAAWAWRNIASTKRGAARHLPRGAQRRTSRDDVAASLQRWTRAWRGICSDAKGGGMAGCVSGAAPLLQ